MADIIVSIQAFEITIGTGAASNTATITSVDTTKSVIFFGGYTTTDTAAGSTSCVRGELTNATTVTAYRNASSATSTCTLRGTVVEFASSAITSIQTGTITLTGATSNTATISSVDTTKSVVFFLGNTSTHSTTSPRINCCRVSLTNATTVTCSRDTNSSNVTAGYAVVEFASAAITSVQQRNVTLTTGNQTDTDTISSVTTSNAIIIWGGWQTGSTTWSNGSYYLQIAGATSVTMHRRGTSIATRTVSYSVLEFASGVLNSLQRNTTSLVGVSSADTAVTSVDTSNAVAVYNGWDTSGTEVNQNWASVRLFDATTVRSQKGSATGNDTTGWEVAEFAAGAAANLVAGPMQVLDSQFVANYGGQGFIDPTIQKLH